MPAILLTKWSKLFGFYRTYLFAYIQQAGLLFQCPIYVFAEALGKGLIKLGPCRGYDHNKDKNNFKNLILKCYEPEPSF